MFKMHLSPAAAALAALAALTLLFPPNALSTPGPLPVRSLTRAELTALSGMPYLTPSNHPFEVAAMAKVKAYNKPSAGPVVQRKTGSDAAVYSGVPLTSVPLAPPSPPTSALLDSEVLADLAQSWATMTADGIPYITLTGYGEFQAEATAAWTTRVTVPAGGSGREVVVRFVIPPVGVSGRTQQQGEALWRSRLRADLLVNGFPAWSAQAIRLTVNAQPLDDFIVLQEFGSPLGFPTDDEDLPADQGGPPNDSSIGNINSPSMVKTVYLTLGRFDPGAVVDLSMILRGTALTAPFYPSGGGVKHRCKDIGGEYECTRGSVSVKGADGQAPRIYLLP